MYTTLSHCCYVKCYEYLTLSPHNQPQMLFALLCRVGLFPIRLQEDDKQNLSDMGEFQDTMLQILKAIQSLSDYCSKLFLTLKAIETQFRVGASEDVTAVKHRQGLIHSHNFLCQIQICLRFLFRSQAGISNYRLFCWCRLLPGPCCGKQRELSEKHHRSLITCSLSSSQDNGRDTSGSAPLL